MLTYISAGPTNENDNHYQLCMCDECTFTCCGLPATAPVFMAVACVYAGLCVCISGTGLAMYPCVFVSVTLTLGDASRI